MAGPLPVLLTVALVLAPGCRSEQKVQQKDERDKLTMEMFRELIQEGTLSPVDSMGDAFADVTPPSIGGVVGQPTEGVEAGPGGEPYEEPDDYSPIPPNDYLRFGRRIKVHEDTGLITKPYPLRTNICTKLHDFIVKYGDFPMWDKQGEQPIDTVRLEIEAGFDVEWLAKDMRAKGPAPGTDVAMGDWLVVTANRDLLDEVELFIDTFAAGPPQIEIEAKIVEWVTRESLDLGVSNANIGFLGDPPHDMLVKNLDWNFPNNAADVVGGEFITQIGTIHDGTTYSAFFEAVASFENVSIISRPKVAVREGTKAKIEAITKLPYLRVAGINASGNISTVLDYQEVGVRLHVTPRMVGTGTIALQIDIENSQQTGSAVTFQTAGATGGGFTDTPILATRSAEALVYLKPGQAVILGGMITERTVEEEDGIPILMDIPLIGYLFKSRLEASELATLLFFIRPRVLGGTDLRQDF